MSIDTGARKRAQKAKKIASAAQSIAGQVIHFQNISQAQNYTKFTAGQVFRTVNYSQPGDGGGTDYIVVNTQPTYSGYTSLSNGLYAQILGPDIPVEAFGAIGDCPDVSNVPGVNQSSIIASVSSSTNNVLAFRNALWAAMVIGASRVTFGTSTKKIFRIAYTNSIVSGLAIPAGVTLQGMTGARLEIDLSLTSEYSSLPNPPTGKAIIHNRFGCGDPSTQYEPQVTGSLGGFIATGGITASTFFVDRPSLIDVDMRQHIRTNWRGYTSNRGWKAPGVQFRFATNARIIGCNFSGMTNTGVVLWGGWGHRVSNCTFRRNGYGAMQNSDQNGLSVVGVPVIGYPDLSSRDIWITDNQFFDNRDEGLAYCATQRIHISGNSFYGCQDRAIEGFFTSTDISSTLGTTSWPSKATITDTHHDGRYTLSPLAQNANASDTTITLTDAWYITAQTQQGGGRWIFIPGASTQTASWRGSILGNVMTVISRVSGNIVPGMVLAVVGSVASNQTVMEQLSGIPGGAGLYRVSVNNTYTGVLGNMSGTANTDGPYQISAVDYSTQIVTLTSPLTNAVSSGSITYGMSTLSLGDGNGNEAHTEVDGYWVKNCYLTLLPLISMTANDNGYSKLTRITISDIILPTVNIGLIGVNRTDSIVEDVVVRRVFSNINGQPVVGIGPNADKFLVDGIDHDGGLSYVIRAESSTRSNTYATRGIIRNVRSGANGLAAIRVDGLINRLLIEQCEFLLSSFGGITPNGFLTLGSTSTRITELIIRKNYYRSAQTASIVPGDAPITYVSGTTAGNIGSLICEDNDFPLGAFTYARQHGIKSSVQARLSTDGISGSVVSNIIRDQNNQVLGSRIVKSSTIPPTTGPFGLGDIIDVITPTPGGVDRARCTTGGMYNTVNRTTTQARLATDNYINVQTASGWDVGTILSIPGATTNGGILTVGGIYDTGGSTIVFLNDVLGGAVSSGATVSVQLPVFKNAYSLSA